MTTDPINDFRSTIMSALGSAPDTIEPGRIHRFATNGRRGDTAGWCQLFADLSGGVFGCTRLGLEDTWSAIRWRNMTRGQRVDLARRFAAAMRLAAPAPGDADDRSAIVSEHPRLRMVRELRHGGSHTGESA